MLSMPPTNAGFDQIPWERLPDEPELWFSRFAKYARRLGYEYTPQRAFRMFALDMKGAASAEAVSVWVKYAEQWQWAERAREWAEWEMFDGERKWQERRAEVREQDFQVSTTLRGVAAAIIGRAPDFVKTSRTETVDDKGQKVIIIRQELKLDVAVRALETASKIARLSAELETNREVVETSVAVKGYAIVSPDDWPEADKSVQTPSVASGAMEGPVASSATDG